jgi:hypothetical protein
MPRVNHRLMPRVNHRLMPRVIHRLMPRVIHRLMPRVIPAQAGIHAPEPGPPAAPGAFEVAP